MSKKQHNDSILAQQLNSEIPIDDQIDEFFQELKVPEVLEKWGCSKRSGKPAEEILGGILKHRLKRISEGANLKVKKIPTSISKDTYYRFLKRQDTDWLRICTELSLNTIEKLYPNYQSDPEQEGIFIIDDTPFRRKYSKKTELLSTQYDDANNEYYLGATLSFLGYYYDGDYVPINYVLATSTDEEKYVAPAKPAKLGSPAQERRDLAAKPLTEVLFSQIQIAKEAGFKGKCLAFDSWYSNPETLFEAQRDGLEAMARLKTDSKTKYIYNGEKHTLQEIYEMNYSSPSSEEDDLLFSVLVNYESEEERLPLKIVFCRPYEGSKAEFVAIASTDSEFSDLTIAELYCEEFHKQAKSKLLMLITGNQCINFDSIYTHIAISLILWLMTVYFR